jgi:hypothetical protein
MKFSWRSLKRAVDYASTLQLESSVFQGVSYRIRRFSLMMRLDLMKDVRELAKKAAHHEAGGSLAEGAAAVMLKLEMERLYLKFGLVDVAGLRIDGRDATKELLLEKGPEELLLEIADSIRKECGLSEAERKN